MPKLSKALQLLEAKKKAPVLAKQEADRVKSLAEARARAEAELVQRIRDAVGFKETDLSPVLSTLEKLPKEIPPQKEVDLSGVLDRLTAVFDEIQQQVIREGKNMREAVYQIPKPKEPTFPKLDLSPVLDDLQWLKTFVALKPDPVIPKQPKVNRFEVQRDRNGFISAVIPVYE